MKRIDYTSIVPMFPIRWDSSPERFKPALDKLIASFVSCLAHDGVHLSKEDAQGLREDAMAYYGRVNK